MKLYRYLFVYSLPLDLITEEQLIDEILNKENEDSKNIVKNEQDIIHDETADSDNGKEVYKALIIECKEHHQTPTVLTLIGMSYESKKNAHL